MNDLYFNCTISYTSWYFVDGSFTQKQYKQSTTQRFPISKPVGSINNAYKQIQIKIMRTIKKSKKKIFVPSWTKNNTVPSQLTVFVINFPKFQITSTSSHFINLNLSSEVYHSKLTRNSVTLSINCSWLHRTFDRS